MVHSLQGKVQWQWWDWLPWWVTVVTVTPYICLPFGDGTRVLARDIGGSVTKSGGGCMSAAWTSLCPRSLSAEGEQVCSLLHRAALSARKRLSASF